MAQDSIATAFIDLEADPSKFNRQIKQTGENAKKAAQDFRKEWVGQLNAVEGAVNKFGGVIVGALTKFTAFGTGSLALSFKKFLESNTAEAKRFQKEWDVALKVLNNGIVSVGSKFSQVTIAGKTLTGWMQKFGNILENITQDQLQKFVKGLQAALVSAIALNTAMKSLTIASGLQTFVLGLPAFGSALGKIIGITKTKYHDSFIGKQFESTLSLGGQMRARRSFVKQFPGVPIPPFEARVGGSAISLAFQKMIDFFVGLGPKIVNLAKAIFSVKGAVVLIVGTVLIGFFKEIFGAFKALKEALPEGLVETVKNMGSIIVKSLKFIVDIIAIGLKELMKVGQVVGTLFSFNKDYIKKRFREIYKEYFPKPEEFLPKETGFNAIRRTYGEKDPSGIKYIQKFGYNTAVEQFEKQKQLERERIDDYISFTSKLKQIYTERDQIEKGFIQTQGSILEQIDALNKQKKAGLGFSGSFVAGAEAVKFAQQVQTAWEKQQTDINKSIKELNEKQLVEQIKQTNYLNNFQSNFTRFMTLVMGGASTEGAYENSF